MNRLAALVSLSRAALRASLLERAPLSSTARSAHTLCAPSTRPSILLPTSTDWALSSRSKSKKSKSSFASNVDEPIEGDPGSVPVLNTKGKGHSKHAKGSSGSPRGAKSKRGDAEQDGGHPDAEEATKTGDRSLEGEMFDVERTRENMKRAVERCRTTLAGMVGMLGRADPALLDPVRVEYPGTGSTPVKEHHPLRDFATVGVRDGALLVTCFDPEMVKHVERAIYAAELGLTPQQHPGGDEGVLRVAVPRPTSETRAALLKDVTRVCENARVSIRSARHAAQKQLKLDTDRKIVGSSESKKEMKTVEDETKKHSAEVDALFEQTKKKLAADDKD